MTTPPERTAASLTDRAQALEALRQRRAQRMRALPEGCGLTDDERAVLAVPAAVEPQDARAAAAPATGPSRSLHSPAWAVAADRVADYLGAVGGATMAAIGKACGMEPHAVRWACRRLLHHGRAYLDRNNIWRLRRKV